jgi:regulator of sirC expression with transglutaminase-like and TPR domain
MLLNWGKYNESIDVFTKLLQLRPDLIANYRNLGFAYANSGDYQQALKYLQLYLDYVPQTQDRIQIETMMQKLEENLEQR